MKNLNINIHPQLKNIEITVKNGAKFTRDIISGEYEIHDIKISEHDLQRVKKFAIRNGNDNSSNYGKWYAHCNGFAMDLFIQHNGYCRINTYRPYGKYKN